MANAPNVGDSLSLMSGHFFFAARLHHESTERAEAEKESMKQSQFALSAIVCVASALEAIPSEARATSSKEDSHRVRADIEALNIASPVKALLRFIPEADQPSTSDQRLLDVCCAYHLRNKFVHYTAEWARDWPSRLAELGISCWTPRDPLLQSNPGQGPVPRPRFPEDVLCTEGVGWSINACSTFLKWWSDTLAIRPWWEGRTVPTKLLTVRLAPQRPV